MPVELSDWHPSHKRLRRVALGSDGLMATLAREQKWIAELRYLDHDSDKLTTHVIRVPKWRFYTDVLTKSPHPFSTKEHDESTLSLLDKHGWRGWHAGARSTQHIARLTQSRRSFEEQEFGRDLIRHLHEIAGSHKGEYDEEYERARDVLEGESSTGTRAWWTLAPYLHYRFISWFDLSSKESIKVLLDWANAAEKLEHHNDAVLPGLMTSFESKSSIPVLGEPHAQSYSLGHEWARRFSMKYGHAILNEIRLQGYPVIRGLLDPRTNLHGLFDWGTARLSPKTGSFSVNFAWGEPRKEKVQRLLRLLESEYGIKLGGKTSFSHGDTRIRIKPIASERRAADLQFNARRVLGFDSALKNLAETERLEKARRKFARKNAF